MFEGPKNDETLPPPIRDPETAEILDHVDFDGLRDIYAEHARRSGIDPKEMHFAPRERIGEMHRSMYLIGAGGGYSPRTQNISVGSEGVSVLSKLDGSGKKEYVLTFLCHEESHACSGQSYEEEEIGDALFGLLKRSRGELHSGVDKRSATFIGSGLAESTRRFTWFNEGITDELGAEVFAEYLRRHPMTEHDASGEKPEYHTLYPLSRLFVRTLCEHLAGASGLPQDVVWKSLLREYFQGNDFASDEIRDMLSEIFSDGFLDRLGKVEGGVRNSVRVSLLFRELMTKDRMKALLSNLVERAHEALPWSKVAVGEEETSDKK